MKVPLISRRLTVSLTLPFMAAQKLTPYCRGRWLDGSLRSCSDPLLPPVHQRGLCDSPPALGHIPDTMPAWTPDSEQRRKNERFKSLI